MIQEWVECRKIEDEEEQKLKQESDVNIVLPQDAAPERAAEKVEAIMKSKPELDVTP